MLGEAELAFLDAQRIAALREVAANLLQLLVADLIKADLVKEAQKPRLAELAGLAIAVPHLQGTADKLIAAGAFHAVDAEVGAADADRVFGGPGARRVVFGGHQTVARVGRRGYRCAEVNVTEAHDQIGRLEQHLLDVVDAV